MRTCNLFGATLLAIVVATTGCKGDSAEEVVETRRKVEEKTWQANRAQAELTRAREEFLQASQQRLDDVEALMLAVESNAAVDQGRVGVMRAEAIALRARTEALTEPYSPETKEAFEKIMRDLEAALTVPAPAPEPTGAMAPPAY